MLVTMFDFAKPGAGLPTIGKKGTINWAEVVKNFATLFLSIGAVMALINIIWAGYRMTTSSGDSQRLSLARWQLIFSVVGLIVILGAFIIWQFALEFISGSGGAKLDFGI